MLDNSSELLSTGAGSSGESIFSGFGSDYNTPAWSEIDDSTLSDDDNEEGDEFLAELTRQMAENMLQEDEEIDEKKPLSYEMSVEHQQSNSTSKYCNGQGIMNGGGTTKSQTPTSVLPNPTPPIYSNHSQKGVQGREYEYGQGSRGTGLLSAYPAGAGMRVVYLGGVGSSGTGVYLPNIAPNANSVETTVAPNHQPRRKTGCSTVLIPERVLQTLQHHFEKRAAQMPLNGAPRTQQNQRLRSHQTTSTMVNNQEFQLPQEWTY